MKRLLLGTIIAAGLFAMPVRAQWLVTEVPNNPTRHSAPVFFPITPTCSVDETNKLTVSWPPGNDATVYRTVLIQVRLFDHSAEYGSTPHVSTHPYTTFDHSSRTCLSKQ